MAFQKITADQLFDGNKLHSNKTLVMNQEMVIDVIDTMDAGSDIIEMDGILSPAFINCHCHLELSHLKNKIDRHTGLIDFVGNVMKHRGNDEEEILNAIDSSLDEMHKNGIIAVGDICNTNYTLQAKKNSRTLFHNFIEVAGIDPSMANKRWAFNVELFEEFETINPGHNSITPHAPYSVSKPLWELLLHQQGSKLFSIHNQETFEETELFLTGTGGFRQMYERMGLKADAFKHPGISSLCDTLPRFPFHSSVILVHNVHTNETDLEYYQQNKNLCATVHWCLCPKANLYISDQLPDVRLLMKYADSIVVGSDSLASNDTLSVLDELKILLTHFNINIEKLLQWATLNGARALQLEDRAGSFEKGKTPGVICVDDALMNVTRLI